MESKLNALALETYSTAFTDRVANDFFARHERINGEEILQLTPVQQVNLFVIKNLFEVWQQEAQRLRSPYFNYNHPKVQEALKVYMNTLSRHISVDEGDLKPLLKKAVQDTLTLAFSPISYLGKALELTEGRPQKVTEVLRYVKIHQVYAKEARSILNRQEVTDPKWVQNLEKALDEQEKSGKLQPEPIPIYLQQFSQVLPLAPSEILKDEELEKAQNAIDEDIDFFSSITGTFDDEERVDTPEIQPTTQKGTPTPDENLPTATEVASRHAQLKREEPDISNKAPQIRVAEPIPAAREERTHQPLNERLKGNNEQKGLNQKLSSPTEKPSLASIHARKKNGSIRTAISLNQRFMFTRELFDGDSQAFNQALDKLDTFSTYEEASQYAKGRYAQQYNWDLEGEESQEFFMILQSRYA